MAVCVGDEIDYVLLEMNRLQRKIYFAEELLTHYGDFEILERVKGSDLGLGSNMNRCLIILLTSKLRVVLL
ncbi:MAG: hypothetical protein Ct9H90mP27_1380 [Gammaproteobacteria bacterium]|nr:MAG: hypothetical protein Ct9H90mP27_1380 [Gammaproteobacteria bacterium]